MANNKVVANGETLIDLTEDTVTPSTMVSGIVAHDATGARIVGTFDPSIFVQKSGDTMTGTLNLTNKDVNIQSASSERVFRIGTQAGGNVSLCYGTSLKHGIYSSGYETSLTDQNTYTSSGKWVISRESDGKVTIPDWASIGNSITPVYINSSGKPEAVSSVTTGLIESPFSRSDTPINQPSHFYDNSKVHMRVEGVFNSAAAFGSSDGFTISLFWDNSGAYDSQLFIPNGAGEPLIRKRKAGSSWSIDPNDTTYYSKIITNTTPTTKTEFTPDYGSAANPSKCWYAKYGKIVEVAMRVINIATDQANHILYTLPSGYRPQTVIPVIVGNAGGTEVTYGTIDGDGRIVVQGLYSSIYLHATFIIA